MISQIRSRWRANAGRFTRFKFRDENGTARRAILAALLQAENDSRVVYLREIHLLAGLDQPNALRCVEVLEKQRKILVKKMVLDPLAGEVTLL